VAPCATAYRYPTFLRAYELNGSSGRMAYPSSACAATSRYVTLALAHGDGVFTSPTTTTDHSGNAASARMVSVGPKMDVTTTQLLAAARRAKKKSR
jgi:hypothetical protein